MGGGEEEESAGEASLPRLECLDGKLTPVSDGTVSSAFSEGELVDVDVNVNYEIRNGIPLESLPPPPPVPEKKASRQRAGLALKKIQAFEALFEDPRITAKVPRRAAATTRAAPTRAASVPASPHLYTRLVSPQILNFHRACQYGQLSTVEAVLRKGEVDVDCRNAFLSTPLHEASMQGQIEVAKLLLKHGADVFAENMTRERPLHVCRSPELAEVLLDFEKYQHSASGSALLACCWRDARLELQAMLQDGADANTADECANTGLHVAALWDNDEAAKLLLAKGAAVDASNAKGNTPLHEACRFSSRKCIRLLLDAGADHSACNLAHRTPLYYSSRTARVVFRKFVRQNGITDPELIAAIVARQFTEVTDEEAEGAVGLQQHRLGAPKTLGPTREERKIQQMLKILAANPNMRMAQVRRKRDKTERPASGRKERAQPVQAKNRKASSKPGQKERGRRGGKSDPEFVDKTTGRTQLHKKAANGQVAELGALLAQYPSLVGQKDNAGYSALHEACLRGHVAIAEALLDAGSDANAQAANGDTPLHDAAENGHEEMVRLLLCRGAKTTIRNGEGRRPADVVANEKTAALFEAAGSAATTPVKKTERQASPARSRGRTDRRKSGRGQENAIEAGLERIFGTTKGVKVAEVVLQEPLVQLHCTAAGTDAAGWYLLGPQVDQLFHQTFPARRLREFIPFSKTRHLSVEDAQLLAESAVMDKLSSLRKYLEAEPMLLMGKESVFGAFERAGGSLSSVPVVYVDLQRLIRREPETAIDRGAERVVSAHLPPKLKMKWQRKTSWETPD